MRREIVLGIIFGTAVGFIGTTQANARHIQSHTAYDPEPIVVTVSEPNTTEYRALTCSDLVADYLRNETPHDDTIPAHIIQSAERWGAEYDVSPELLEAIAWRESRFTENAVNGTCKGLMQINTKVHADRISRLNADIWTADGALMVAADYLRELFDRYEDPGAVLAAYHGENDGVAKANKGELSKYTATILELSAQYERNHNK